MKSKSMRPKIAITFIHAQAYAAICTAVKYYYILITVLLLIHLIRLPFTAEIDAATALR